MRPWQTKPPKAGFFRPSGALLDRPLKALDPPQAGEPQRQRVLKPLRFAVLVTPGWSFSDSPHASHVFDPSGFLCPQRMHTGTKMALGFSPLHRPQFIQ